MNDLQQNEKAPQIKHVIWPVHKRRIHVYETDKDGVVHFSNYLRIAEEAVFAGFRSIGFPLEQEGRSIAMLKTSVNYHLPIKFTEQVDVVLVGIEAKRVRFSLEFEFYCAGQVCARIQLIFATIAPDERRAIPLDPDIRQTLSRVITSQNNTKQAMA